MAANVTTDSSLSSVMKTYYDKIFLSKAEFEFIFQKGGQARPQPKNEGKSVNFTRFDQLAVSTSALTEGSNPSEVALSATTVSATLAEYGLTAKISRFLSLTDIDANNEEKISVVGANMGRTLDTLARNALVTGATTQFAGAKAALSLVASSDVFSASEIRKAVTALKKADAIPYTDLPTARAKWIGKVGPDTSYDLMNDTTWINSDIYDNGAEKTYSGSLGALYGVMFYESNNQYVDTDAGVSSAEVYSNLIHGKEAFGYVELDGDKPQLFIIPHTKIDSNNPAGRFSTASWAGSYVCKVLKSTWIRNVKSGSTYA